MLKAVTRQASLVDAKIDAINAVNIKNGKGKISTAYFFDHFADKEDVAVMVTEEDFVCAERELVPSVSLNELEHYKRVRAQFEKPDKEGEGKLRIGNGEEKKSNGKGKGKVADKKGKGKATWDDEEEDDFYSGGAVTNGGVKGKGKAIDLGFREGTLEDEDGLY
jgi:peroxin-6